jgi:hypothetical protein
MLKTISVSHRRAVPQVPTRIRRTRPERMLRRQLRSALLRYRWAVQRINDEIAAVRHP